MQNKLYRTTFKHHKKEHLRKGVSKKKESEVVQRVSGVSSSGAFQSDAVARKDAP